MDLDFFTNFLVGRQEENLKAIIELRLELDPVEPEGVEGSGESPPQTEHADSKYGPEHEDDVDINIDGADITLEPEDDPVLASPLYRKQLAMGLFYKVTYT